MAQNLFFAIAQRATNSSDGPDYSAICLASPDLPLCAYVPNYYSYRINLAANAAFLALFSLSFLGYVLTYAITRRGLAFTIALLLGLAFEILGYVGRILSWKNQWQDTGFLMQICCLTIGPAFISAGTYLCLRRIVYTFGPTNSRLAPEWYTRVFIPCDVISLVLQAVGGALASIASQNNDSVDLGDNIMIAGLAFQVFTLLVFISCGVDFGIRSYRRYSQLGEEAFDQSSAARNIRGSVLFKGFIAALSLSTICIFWRSVYRVAELSDGWTGPLMQRQGLFIGFEGVMVIVATVVLNIFHPSVCIKEMMEGAGGLGGKRAASTDSETKGSGIVSDADETTAR
ncbi:RTA1 like protein-domain-containing protein [Lipomyces tetrasporus]|uniref:RTA1 like protein-domain-containing protein n=1 Tax=Lipomyces tetrasporus TaxID=54092 RepID=A0AAD7QKA4_9ASCO|nr:RTA1 like protein-domain-containing protein [Lipomyces tetrasporus]KAJ8096426.1 RTA1 like protein-domain-containing protein [Lipomyces tetrasporus]